MYYRWGREKGCFLTDSKTPRLPWRQSSILGQSNNLSRVSKNAYVGKEDESESRRTGERKSYPNPTNSSFLTVESQYPQEILCGSPDRIRRMIFKFPVPTHLARQSRAIIATDAWYRKGFKVLGVKGKGWISSLDSSPCFLQCQTAPHLAVRIASLVCNGRTATRLL